MHLVNPNDKNELIEYSISRVFKALKLPILFGVIGGVILTGLIGYFFSISQFVMISIFAVSSILLSAIFFKLYDNYLNYLIENIVGK